MTREAQEGSASTRVRQRRASDPASTKSGQGAREQSESGLADALGMMGDVVYSLDPQSGRRIFFNPAVERLSGLEIQAFEADINLWLDLIHLDDRDKIAGWKEELVAAGLWEKEYRIARPDGEIRWVRDRARATRDQQGRLLRIDGIASDITAYKQTEDALRASEERFALFMKHLPGVAFIKDLEGRYVYFNEMGRQLFERDPGELIGLTDQDLWPEATAAQFRAGDQRALAEGRAISTVETSPHADGLHFWLTSKFPIADRSGVPAMTGGIGIDITEHQRAEEALRESERFARATIDALPNSICVVNESGRIVAANKAWRDFAAANGADADRVSEGADYFKVCQSAAARSNPLAGEFLAGVRSIIAGKCQQFSIEYDCHSPTEQRWCVATVTRFPGDGPMRLVVTHEDVSESKRAAEALRQSEERLNSILGSLNDVIWSLAPDTHQPLYMNDAAQQLYGYPVRAFFEDRGLWKRLLHPEDRERVLGSLTELLANGRCELEYRIVRADGSERWVRDRARVIYGEGGDMLRLDGIVTDITDLKQAQDALRENTSRLQRLAAHLESVREEQSANIAREVHDELGGTLTMLKLGLASVLYKTKPMEPVRHQLEAMLAQVDTSIQAVKRISTTLRPGMLDTLGLMATIKWYVGEFSRLTGIVTELELPEYIRLSPDRSTAVFRIIQEALTNVARHAGASEVRVSVHKHRGRLILELRDNGQGIGDAQANRPGSFGVLGMRERAQYLGGELSIRGVPDQGTTLVLSIPLREAVHGENSDR